MDPRSGEVVRLYHPRRDAWSKHFTLAADGRIHGQTTIGRATARLLRLNGPERIAERQLLIEVGIQQIK